MRHFIPQGPRAPGPQHPIPESRPGPRKRHQKDKGDTMSSAAPHGAINRCKMNDTMDIISSIIWDYTIYYGFIMIYSMYTYVYLYSRMMELYQTIPRNLRSNGWFSRKIWCSVRFPFNLQHFGAGSCHFNCIARSGVRTSHFP